jgi:hypothetical protein
MKLFWLTFTMGFICLVSNAQQANDSANQQQTARENFSLFSSFTYIIKDINKVLLQWSVDSSAGNDYFIVEHGKDTAHFETLGILKKTDEATQYEMIDNNALSGFNYYRIKCMDSAGLVTYSKILQVSSGKADFKFYPNPADKLLIVETERFSGLQIINAMGAVLISKQLQSGIQVINISSLEKGDYILRAVDKLNNKVVLEHLLKN